MKVCRQASSLQPLENGCKLIVLSLQLDKVIYRHLLLWHRLQLVTHQPLDVGVWTMQQPQDYSSLVCDES